jgi:LmbE family N-acetylglucosaminyl deacetylase
VVLSPHFDDAALSCGHLLARADVGVVVTVFAGTPGAYPSPLTNWDARCGFREGDDVVAVRRAEDEGALAALTVKPVTLDFVEAAYRGKARVEASAIAAALEPVLGEHDPTSVAFPLALWHRDHLLVRSAALTLRRADDGRAWIAYGEFPYVWRQDDLAARRVAGLRRRGYRLTPVLAPPSWPVAKSEAIRAYRSQIAGMGLVGHLDRVGEAAEHLWLVRDRPPLAVRAWRWAAYRSGLVRADATGGVGA